MCEKYSFSSLASKKKESDSRIVFSLPNNIKGHMHLKLTEAFPLPISESYYDRTRFLEKIECNTQTIDYVTMMTSFGTN